MKTGVNNWLKLIEETERITLRGENLSFERALALTEIPDDQINKLCESANRVRKHFSQDKVDLCSIINARSGKCSEDCKFCTQSSHYKTSPPTYPMKTVAEIVDTAKAAEKAGAHRFCIVTSGGQLNDKDFETALQATAEIKKETSLKRCASLGKLTKKRAEQLKEAGLNRFHHNLETAESFFPEICTTHSFTEKLETINYLQDAGIEVCSGGIFNLGESPKQRIEMAFKLKELEATSIPINFLNPCLGTPLAERGPISALEAAKYLAIYRFILPRAFIRLAGGRKETFAEDAELPFEAGVNALLIGDLLTTKGPGANKDIALLKSVGFDVEP
jgi:biotin synthase